MPIARIAFSAEGPKTAVIRIAMTSEGKAKTFYSIKQAQGTNCYLKKRIHCGRRGSGTDGKMN